MRKIFSIFRLVPTYFILKWSQDDSFNFFAIFLRILSLVSGKNGSEWEKKFHSFSGLSRSVSFWNKARMMLFNLLNFFAIFFGILLLGSGKNGFERENFFLSLSERHKPFRLEMKAGWCLIFEFFCYLFRNSQARVGKKRFLTNLCRPVSVGNEARMMF